VEEAKKEEPFVSKYPKNKDNRFDLNEEKFSYVIFGTGLTESIIGASLAMHGKKCLHLDRADKYGGTICNFNLENFLKFVHQNIHDKNASDLPFSNFKCHIPLDKSRHGDIMKNHGEFLRYSRRFNIDIAPKIMFCKSLSVDSLIRCQASSYL